MHYQGRYQAKAWASKLGGAIAHVYGSSIKNVQEKLVGEIDNGHTQERIKEIILRKHTKFLLRKGINLEEIDPIQLVEIYDKINRKTHCYECHSSLNNEIDMECSRCNWIVCTCGACGCGHPKFLNKDTPLRYIKNQLQSETRPNNEIMGAKEVFFHSFQDAKKFAFKHPGSILHRNNDNGWAITIKQI